MKEIMQKLREVRKSKDITIDELYRFLLENNVQVAKKTVYGWDSATTTPNIKTFLLMCKFYGIKDVYSLLEVDMPEDDILPISNIEKELIEQFRKKKEYKKPIMKLLDLE